VKCHQYSSIEPKLAMSLSAMSRASAAGWPSRSGNTVPSTEQPVRITSIGCALAGTSSSASCTIAGRPRRRFNLAL
jgi:hypothetical protein